MRLLRSPPVWFSGLLIAALGSYFAWLDISGAAKFAASGLQAGNGPYNVEVALSVAPEQFHMTRLQATGRFMAFRDGSAFIMNMPETALEELARNYWVAAIKPWEGPPA